MGMSEKNLFDLLSEGSAIKRIRCSPAVSGPVHRTLDDLARQAAGCTDCRLRQNASKVVFGQGDANAELMFVGEGPGGDEDLQGLPFVGAAGQLLNRILAAAEISRQEVYIANIVKCRPPENRTPHKEEVEACLPYLQEQIRLIAPKIIVCLGSLATQTLVDPKAKISHVRGSWFERDGIRIMPTFHPAALLRDPSRKRPVWEDIQQIRDAYRKIRPKGVM
jgi:uracil-DNA glycosylase